MRPLARRQIYTNEKNALRCLTPPSGVGVSPPFRESRHHIQTRNTLDAITKKRENFSIWTEPMSNAPLQESFLGLVIAVGEVINTEHAFSKCLSRDTRPFSITLMVLAPTGLQKLELGGFEKRDLDVYRGLTTGSVFQKSRFLSGPHKG